MESRSPVLSFCHERSQRTRKCHVEISGAHLILRGAEHCSTQNTLTISVAHLMAITE